MMAWDPNNPTIGMLYPTTTTGSLTTTTGATYYGGSSHETAVARMIVDAVRDGVRHDLMQVASRVEGLAASVYTIQDQIDKLQRENAALRQTIVDLIAQFKEALCR